MNEKSMIYMGIIIIGLCLFAFTEYYTIAWKLILGGFVIGAIRSM